MIWIFCTILAQLLLLLMRHHHGSEALCYFCRTRMPRNRSPIKAPVTPTRSPTRAPVTPTKPPVVVVTPTVAPVFVAPPLTLKPVSPPVPTTNFPPFPLGPYVTSATSSKLVTIPDPPQPDMSSSNVNTRKDCPHLQAGLLDWHSPATWTGVSIPAVGQNVTLPSNTKVVVTSTVYEPLGYIIIPSTSQLILGEDSNGISLDALGMELHGAFIVGSATCRILTPVTITLHGKRPTDAVTNPRPVAYKGIAVQGTLSLHGKRYFHTWSRLAKTVNPGDSVVLLQHGVNWEAGQQIVLTTTAMKDSKEWHQNEVFIISAVHPSPPANVGAIVYLTTTAKYKHLANNAYQAEVGLLSRKIVIQGAANDSEPTDPDPLTCTDRQLYGNGAQPCPNTALTGFGAHVVVYQGGRGFVEGVELYRVGQTNVLGKYPMHFHLLGECPSCYFRDSSIHRSYYRCISIHGTNSSLTSENVGYDVTGYCYYLEDGVESNNTISFNLAALIHNIGPQNPWSYEQTTLIYQQSATLTNPADVTASGFYITNVHNNIVGNAASGGWSGFAFPILPTALQTFRSLAFRPSSVTSLTIDGNTAHSTGWWWYHIGAFYLGGTLYYNANNLLEYNPGRDFSGYAERSSRMTCTINACLFGDCTYGCPEYNMDAVRLTNTKAFLVTSVGLTSWVGRIELKGFESHDVSLMMDIITDGFWLDRGLTVCRTGESLVFPSPGNPTLIPGTGFFWYDTYVNHIITNTEFRNCGYRSDKFNQYDTSPSRGCGDSLANGCSNASTTFGFLAYSNEYIPQVMQGTKNITFTSCGRRFRLLDFRGDSAPESGSGRSQNWLDADGSVTGFHVPSIIGSGKAGAQGWWQVDDEVVYDPQGPLRFIKQTNGPQRGLGHVRMLWDDAVNSQVGVTVCTDTSIPCPALGYVRHLGYKFSPSISGAAPGMPVDAAGNIVGPVGGYGWLLNFYAGAPKSISFPEVVVLPDTPLLLSIPYPKGTAFTITARGPTWCSPDGKVTCQQQFYAVSSVSQVRNGQGNVYYVDSNGVLTVRLVQLPQSYVGDPNWFLPTLTHPGVNGLGFALNFFQRDGITLPRVAFGSYYTLQADCPATGAYCNQSPPTYDPNMCPNGYQQVAYDTCCSTTTSHCVYADGSST